MYRVQSYNKVTCATTAFLWLCLKVLLADVSR